MVDKQQVGDVLTRTTTGENADLADALVVLDGFRQGRTPAPGKIVIRKVEIREDAILLDRRLDVRECARLDVDVEAKL
jgi:hypothetical protein